jgi:hypothetical protein
LLGRGIEDLNVRRKSKGLQHQRTLMLRLLSIVKILIVKDCSRRWSLDTSIPSAYLPILLL